MGHGQGPGLVHAPAEGRVQDKAPVARLVLTALHNKPSVRRHRARALPLGSDESGQVAPRAFVQPVGAQPLAQSRGQEGILPVRGGLHPGRMLGALARIILRRTAPHAAVEGPHEGTAGAPGLEGTRGSVAVPERQAPRTARGRFHDDAVGADLLDAPRARAQRDDIAHARFHHHLLVELAHAAASLPRVALGQHHREHAAVGNGARGSHREPLRRRARLQEPRLAIPQDAGRELGHLARGVAPGEHVEHALEGART